MYSNAQILGAVIGKFAAPLLSQIGCKRLSAVPAIQAIENRIRATGWVGAKWSLMSEIEPFADVVAQSIAGPMVAQFLSGVPDNAIPRLAHGIVDKAIDNGKLELLDGKICFDAPDLARLKEMLDTNLPLGNDNDYTVK